MNIDDIKRKSIKQLARDVCNLQIGNKIVDLITLESFEDIIGDTTPTLSIGVSLIYLSLVKDGLSLLKQFIIHYWNNYNLNNPYHNSEGYKQIKLLYTEYVKKISDYFQEIGLHDPILIADYFNTLVKHGGISKTDEFEFKNIDDSAIVNNLIGSNVVLGAGCCRHLASLLSDIYKEMGFEAKCLLVKTYRNNFINIPGKIIKFPNHLVVLVKTYKGNIIVDPLNNVFGNINKKRTSTERLFALNEIKEKQKFAFSCSFDGDFVLDIKDDYLISKNNRILTKEEIVAATKLTDQIKQRVPINNFKEKNKELIMELSNAVKQI